MNRALCLLLTGVSMATSPALTDTLPPLDGDAAPATVDDLWTGFDPRSEPLDTEILQEWEEDDVVLRVLRYRIGVFKDDRAMMAAVYGFPKGGRDLPGLVQIHGGGQYADWRAPLTNAKRGYATVSISWAGRISAPDYHVNPAIVKLFWDGKTEDPNYRLTTDWGPLDGYHAPSRHDQGNFARISPAEWTLDAVDSPRNNPWFLAALGARRALTFLERQPEVDAARLGVYGHSMGGKLTVMTAAADGRVKAAAPSCGGVSDRMHAEPLYRGTIGDDASLIRISCPIIFLSPANDFHGRIDDLQTALTEIATDEWRVTCSPHHNHQDTEPYQVAGPLWFDQHLKKGFTFPETPETALTLRTGDRVPVITVTPDTSRKILSVDVFYTQQGEPPAGANAHEHTIARFWHHAATTERDGRWTARLSLPDTDHPLWVCANVLYALDAPVTGAGYYYAPYAADAVNLSSRMHIVTPEELKQADVRPALPPSPVIETFESGWQKEWFTYDLRGHWARRTHKVYSPVWKAPPFAKLALDVRSDEANVLVVGIDGAAAEVALAGGAGWQQVLLYPTDFKDAGGDTRQDWHGIRELRLGAEEHLRPKDGPPIRIGGDWQGPDPAFRNLRWIHGTREELNTRLGK